VRAVVQRVARASVTADGGLAGSIGRGFLVLLGVGSDDTEATAERMAAKIAGLRLFEDNAGMMNLGLAAVGGAVLCISQFTLYGDVRRGRRPSFDRAAAPEPARRLYEAFCAAIERAGLTCERGVFGAHMEVELLNDGPVTLVIDSADLDLPRRT
jgi:D-tyrosyl-tRNA(Tyr) deacylase